MALRCSQVVHPRRLLSVIVGSGRDAPALPLATLGGQAATTRHHYGSRAYRAEVAVRAGLCGASAMNSPS